MIASSWMLWYSRQIEGFDWWHCPEIIWINDSSFGFLFGLQSLIGLFLGVRDSLRDFSSFLNHQFRISLGMLLKKWYWIWVAIYFFNLLVQILLCKGCYLSGNCLTHSFCENFQLLHHQLDVILCFLSNYFMYLTIQLLNYFIVLHFHLTLIIWICFNIILINFLLFMYHDPLILLFITLNYFVQNFNWEVYYFTHQLI